MEWMVLGSADLHCAVQDDWLGGNAIHPFHGQPFQLTFQHPGCLWTHPIQGCQWLAIS
jgi:hypothetical protein